MTRALIAIAVVLCIPTQDVTPVQVNQRCPDVTCPACPSLVCGDCVCECDCGDPQAPWWEVAPECPYQTAPANHCDAHHLVRMPVPSGTWTRFHAYPARPFWLWCLTGPGAQVTDGICQMLYDADSDCDVDLEDFACYQNGGCD